MGLHRCLTAATGFCELGMWQDAWDKLETLRPDDRARPEVSDLRLQIFIGLGAWEAAAVLAEGMLRNKQHTPAAYLLGAYAIRRHRSLADALAFLLRGSETMQEHPTWHFNLACYHCQTGELEAAKERLQVAFKLRPEFRMLALNEEDLAPLWDSLSTPWP